MLFMPYVVVWCIYVYACFVCSCVHVCTSVGVCFGALVCWYAGMSVSLFAVVCLGLCVVVPCASDST